MEVIVARLFEGLYATRRNPSVQLSEKTTRLTHPFHSTDGLAALEGNARSCPNLLQSAQNYFNLFSIKLIIWFQFLFPTLRFSVHVFAFTGSPHAQFDAIFEVLRRDWSVTVIAPGAGGVSPQNVVTYPRPSVQISDRAERARVQFLSMAEAAKDAFVKMPFQPDLIFGQASFGCLAQLGGAFGGPIVAHVELPGLEYAMSRPSYPVAADTARTDLVVRGQVLGCLAQAHAIITPTQYSRSLLPANLQAKCSSLMEGFDTRAPLSVIDRRAVLHQTGLDPDKPMIGFFARTLELVRGFDRFLSAARHLAQARPDLQILIVGEATTRYGPDPEYERSGQSIAQRLLKEVPSDIQRRLYYTGFVEQSDMHALMDAADVAVYPIYEGAGTWGVFEALAGGTPVVASDRAFLPEIIEHGTSGILVDPDSKDALVNAVSWALDNSDAAARMGAAGKSTIAQSFSVEIAANGYRRVFETAFRQYRR